MTRDRRTPQERADDDAQKVVKIARDLESSLRSNGDAASERAADAIKETLDSVSKLQGG